MMAKQHVEIEETLRIQIIAYNLDHLEYFHKLDAKPIIHYADIKYNDNRNAF